MGPNQEAKKWVQKIGPHELEADGEATDLKMVMVQ
jgi:hypothetical protein